MEGKEIEWDGSILAGFAGTRERVRTAAVKWPSSSGENEKPFITQWDPERREKKDWGKEGVPNSITDSREREPRPGKRTLPTLHLG